MDSFATITARVVEHDPQENPGWDDGYWATYTDDIGTCECAFETVDQARSWINALSVQRNSNPIVTDPKLKLKIPIGEEPSVKIVEEKERLPRDADEERVEDLITSATEE